MEILIVKDSVIYNGVKRAAGEIVNVSDEHGANMIKRGLAKRIVGEPEKKATDEGGGAGEAEPDEGGANPNPPEPPMDLEQMSYDELLQELSLRGIPFKPNIRRDHVIRLLKEALDK